MNSLMRTMKYWSRMAVIQLASISILFLILVFGPTIMGASANYKMGMDFMYTYGLIFIVVLSINVNTYIPIVLCNNSTRKQAFLGAQLYNLITVIGTYLTVVILSMIVDSGNYTSYVYNYIPIYILMLGISNILSFIIIKFGKNGLFLFLVIVGCVAGGISAYLMATNGGINISISTTSLYIVGAVAFVIGYIVNYFVISKYEVKI